MSEHAGWDCKLWIPSLVCNEQWATHHPCFCNIVVQNIPQPFFYSAIISSADSMGKFRKCIDRIPKWPYHSLAMWLLASGFCWQMTNADSPLRSKATDFCWLVWSCSCRLTEPIQWNNRMPWLPSTSMNSVYDAWYCLHSRYLLQKAYKSYTNPSCAKRFCHPHTLIHWWIHYLTMAGKVGKKPKNQAVLPNATWLTLLVKGPYTNELVLVQSSSAQSSHVWKRNLHDSLGASYTFWRCGPMRKPGKLVHYSYWQWIA